MLQCLILAEMICVSVHRERVEMMLHIFLVFAKTISAVRAAFLSLLTPSFIPFPSVKCCFSRSFFPPLFLYSCSDFTSQSLLRSGGVLTSLEARFRVRRDVLL